MIERWKIDLPHGIRLSCRSAGDRGRPLMVFLHGFPEGAFIWDPLLEHFAKPENGGYRCVAPNLRGFEQSSAPADAKSYRPEEMLKDLMALASAERDYGRIHVLVGHDWGGAFAWAAAGGHGDRIERLVIINSPHPATFARELKKNPAQQKASAYMNFLARPDAEQLLAVDDYRRMWPFFLAMNAGPDGFGWLTESVRQQYRELWDHGLTGACNLYRVTPLKPPMPGQADVPDIPQLSVAQTRVDMPTLVLWGLDDTALLPGLLEGLEDYVPQLVIEKMPQATHWVVHEQPGNVAARISAFVGAPVAGGQ